MANEEPIQLTKKQRINEIEALNFFLTFADRIADSLNNRRKVRLDQDERDAVQLTYNRLEREMRRKATGGRPKSATTAVDEIIASQIEYRGKKWMVKNPAPGKIEDLEDLCAEHGTTYKSFWRRWNKKQPPTAVPLEDRLAKIEILQRLASDAAAQGKQDRVNFAEIVETVRNLPARTQSKDTREARREKK